MIKDTNAKRLSGLGSLPNGYPPVYHLPPVWGSGTGTGTRYATHPFPYQWVNRRGSHDKVIEICVYP